MIKAFLFDVSGVLTNANFKEIYIAANDKLGLPKNTLTEYYKDHLQNQLIGTEKFVDLYAFVKDFLPGLSYNSFKLLYTTILIDATTVDTDILQLVDKLRTRYTCGILTNNTEARSFNDIALRLYDHFDFVLQSQECGLKKPDPVFFQLGIAQTNCSPEEIVYVDDQERHARAARDLGMHGIVYTFRNTIGFIQSLKELGVEI